MENKADIEMKESNGVPEHTIVDRLPLVENGEIAKPLANSNYCMWTLFLSVSSVMMSTGIAVGAMNASMAILGDFYNQTYYERYDNYIPEDTSLLLIALTVSGLLAGGILGALSIGFILARFSRKQSMAIMNLTNILAVATLCIGGPLIPSYECIIIGRFIMGLFSGFGMNLIPIVVAEISNQERQAFYLSLIGVNLSFGGLFGLVLGFKEALGTEELWPILLTISSAPSIAYLLALKWLPETPSYLLRQGKRTQALQVLRKLRQNAQEEKLCQELAKIEREQRAHGEIKQVPLITMFKSTGYRRQLIAVVMVFMQAQLCGVNGVGMYTNRIFMSAGFNESSAITASTIVYSIQFVVALVGSGAVDRWGPKMINVISGSVMSASLVLLTVAMVTSAQVEFMLYVNIVAVTIYILSWACGINLTLFPLLGALTTEQTREVSFTFGGGIFWVLSWFVGFITPYFMEWMGPFAFFPWAILNAIFAAYVLIFIPDIKGKSREYIESFVRKGKVNFCNCGATT
uniref:Solute carrier family 2, facilitated glucose transporter member 1-like n=1 Tax=Phallusia mammillata TaxID=59560 RepID=A0A6F9DRX8_9ASCI|nr:solute carrier family 2, facilitated glucose transporter member 1-like [Phallusia mammillata]